MRGYYKLPGTRASGYINHRLHEPKLHSSPGLTLIAHHRTHVSFLPPRSNFSSTRLGLVEKIPLLVLFQHPICPATLMQINFRAVTSSTHWPSAAAASPLPGDPQMRNPLWAPILWWLLFFTSRRLSLGCLVNHLPDRDLHQLNSLKHHTIETKKKKRWFCSGHPGRFGHPTHPGDHHHYLGDPSPATPSRGHLYFPAAIYQYPVSLRTGTLHPIPRALHQRVPLSTSS
ncbi:hypothetical protein RchiOBHm_Chr5g0048381 [Rosa chinensis]|uniref:Uncharacterized protein n=1 Tax=Rosa chinensis TaxID=74649 RepID=A0A2P6QEM3_ROSCH|nr:hypothetical protein RchiOBHm_Chr5g0048381 [Rosa chinensis]